MDGDVDAEALESDSDADAEDDELGIDSEESDSEFILRSECAVARAEHP